MADERFLVVTEGHGLLPWARRLSLWGYDVATYTNRRAYGSCWSGIMDVRVAPRYERMAKCDAERGWGALYEEVLDGGRTLLTDAGTVSEIFREAPFHYGVGRDTLVSEPPAALYVPLWWENGEAHTSHVFIPDVGAWTGGQGPDIWGAGTLSQIWHIPGLFECARDMVADRADETWQGLALVGVRLVGGAFEAVSCTLGWPKLLSDLWLWRVERSGAVGWPAVKGDTGGPSALVGVAVSVPPWPHYPWSANRPCSAVDVECMHPGQIAFHGVQLRGSQLATAACDGLIGYAVGEGRTFVRARRMALEVAAQVRAPGVQWRADGGATAELAIAQLDGLSIVSLPVGDGIEAWNEEPPASIDDGVDESGPATLGGGHVLGLDEAGADSEVQ